MSLKIIFMGTPGFALPALQSIIDSNYELLAVYTQAPKPSGRGYKESFSPVYELAKQHNILIQTPKTLRSKETQEAILLLKPDIVIVAAYGLILPQEVLDIPKYGCLNIHPSLLPRWRGAAPIQRTIMAGDQTTAICIMQMDAGLDSGDILMQENMDLNNYITTGELHDIAAQKGAELLMKTINLIKEGNPPLAKKQSTQGITYAKKIDKLEGKINWNRSAYEIDCHIRGLYPWPGSYFIYDNERIKILKADYQEEYHHHLPGTIIDSKLKIACNDGYILPKIVQRPGKKTMQIEEMLKGFNIKVNIKL